MKRVSFLVFVLSIALALNCFAQEQNLLIADFEGPITAGPDGTLDFGAGNGSSINVTAAPDMKYAGKQSIMVKFDAVSGGYMWIAKGFGLDASNSNWLTKPEAINWAKYNAFSFYVYGNNSNAQIAFDVKDSGNEIWRFITVDNFRGWKQIVCPFTQFTARSDWQPDTADKNSIMDFPVKSFQFEILPEARGTLYFDNVELIKQ